MHIHTQGKGPYYSYPHEYQDVNYGHLYQPVPTDHPQNLHYYQPIPPNQYQQQHVDYYQPVPHNPTIETDRNNYYQPVPDDQNVVTNQPAPVINPVSSPHVYVMSIMYFYQKQVVARRDGSFDKAVIVSICMTGAALLLSSLLLLLCSIPTIYCIYEVRVIFRYNYTSWHNILLSFFENSSIIVILKVGIANVM